jgi:hypothetical protein
MKLLYRTAEWHGFAKLRIHTDFTLNHLEELTKEFGLLMRQFRDLSCSQFQTVELPREVEGRKRRQQRAQAKQLPASASTGTGVRSELTAVSSSNNRIPAPTAQPTPSTANANATATTSNASPTSTTLTAPSSTSTSRKLKTLNIFTYKFHSLGDYVRTIRLFGGTDSFSTQLVRFLYPEYYFIETDLVYSLG